MTKVFLNVVFFVGLLVASVTGNTKNWDNIFTPSQYKNAKISPDGKHLAVSTLLEGEIVLAFLDRETLTAMTAVKLPGSLEVGQFYWVNNERVVIKVVKKDPWLEAPQFYGELYAVNSDGSKGKMIFGYRAGEMQTGSRIKKKESTFGWGDIVDILPEDEAHILISSTPMDKFKSIGEKLASVLKVNVYTGIIKKKLGRSPIPFSQFITDSHGKVKVVVGTDNNNDRQVYYKKNNDWTKIPTETVGDKPIPLFIDASGKHLYTIDNYKQDISGIFKLDLETHQYKSVFTDNKVNVTNVEMTTDSRAAYAVRIDDGYPAYLILNKQLEEAKVFKRLIKTFPYSEINITSKSDNGRFFVVLVSSDIAPGTLYLFDTKNNEMKSLFTFKPDFTKTDFAQVEPIKFEALDGTILNGFFTQAKATHKDKLAPTVVLVHGGPHGVRDYWQFSSQVQYLVSHGFSVLQVNYRGSGGFGLNYQESGYKTWGNLIQQDISDGYQWLVKNKKAADNNVCIMGASFGAYSAIQSTTLYPDIYKCAIANAGIYDLELMFEEGDVYKRKAGLSYLKRVLGTDEQSLKSMSPVHYVAKIQVPLLLAHGEEDQRAPFEHAERLRSALDKEKKAYEWFAIDKEGHGFYNAETQKNYMRKVVTFLNSHLVK